MTKIATTPEGVTNQQEVLPPNWHTIDKFTGDEMIDAYFLGISAGIKAGFDEKFKIRANQGTRNIESAVKIS